MNGYRVLDQIRHAEEIHYRYLAVIDEDSEPVTEYRRDSDAALRVAVTEARVFLGKSAVIPPGTVPAQLWVWLKELEPAVRAKTREESKKIREHRQSRSIWEKAGLRR